MVSKWIITYSYMGYIGVTPPKFNMEPENDGFQKESPFPGLLFRFHVKFQGCIGVISSHLQTIDPNFLGHPSKSPGTQRGYVALRSSLLSRLHGSYGVSLVPHQ